MNKLTPLAYAILVGGICLSCGGAEAPSAPPPPVLPLTIVSGASVADTIQATLRAPVVVAVRTAAGAPRGGITVRFDAIPPTDTIRRSERTVALAPRVTAVFATSDTETTDSQGRASVFVQLGTIAGPARVVVTTDDGMTDTLSFSVLAGAPSRLVVPIRDTTIYPNDSFALGATVRDRFGNVRTELPTGAVTALVGTAPTLSADGTVRAAASIGRARIVLQGAGRSDSSFVSVVPAAQIVASDGDNAVLGLRVTGLNGKLTRLLLKVLFAQFAFQAYPSWAPDGTHIVVTTFDGNSVTNLLLLDTLGNYTTIVPAPPYPAQYGAAQFSRDGQWLYFAQVNTFVVPSPAALYRVHPDGSGKQLVYSSTTDDGFWRAPSPSATGDFAIVNGSTVGTGPSGSPVGAPVTARLDVALQRLSRFQANGSDAVYSATADRVAMIDADGRIMIARPDGSDVRTITSNAVSASSFGPLSQPTWSPDGNFLLAHSSSAGRIVVVRVSDGLTIPTVLPSRLSWQAWRP